MDDSERQKSIDDLEIVASQSWNSNQDQMGVFVRKLKEFGMISVLFMWTCILINIQ